MADIYEHRPEGKRVRILDTCCHCGEFIYTGDVYYNFKDDNVHEECRQAYMSSKGVKVDGFLEKLDYIYDKTSDKDMQFVGKFELEDLRTSISKVYEILERWKERGE